MQHFIQLLKKMNNGERTVFLRKQFVVRWTFYIIGMAILGLGLAMTIKGQRLGIGPWDVLSYGLMLNFGGTIGMWTILSGLAIVILTAIVLREWPQVGTWLNMLLMGIFIDLFLNILPTPASLIGNFVIFILGVLVMSIGIGLYVAMGVGAGLRDGLMLIFVEKFKWSIKTARTIIEIVVAMIGWLLGGPVGIGTVIVALSIGHLVHHTLPFFQSKIKHYFFHGEEYLFYK